MDTAPPTKTATKRGVFYGKVPYLVFFFSGKISLFLV
jgi:hypothetical protein